MTLWQRRLLAWALMCALGAGRLGAQSAAATDAVLKGSVLDASGAQVAHAQVHAEPAAPVRHSENDTDAGGLIRDAAADATGHFLLALPGGTYTITVQSPGFDPYVRENLKLDPGQHVDLPVKLLVAAIIDVVNVPADASASTDPADNKSALTFQGDQLQVFSDDSTVLQQQLSAIAGGDPSLPPQVLIDGFANGQFPPKSSIREIRINQNPYSAQYDQSGQGRVEVFTKPGSGSFHGFMALAGNDSPFNARNPYITSMQSPYHRERFFGDVSGPLGKNMTFDLGSSITDDDNNSPVNATVLNSALAAVAIQGVVPSPESSQNYTARLDRQIGANDTATLRYSFTRSAQTNSGLGPLTLASEATDMHTLTQTLQAGDTHVIGARVVSESRFQYNRTEARTDPVSSTPTLIVQGSFNGGGAPGQALHDHQDRFEFQEYVSVALKNHLIRTGARYRLTRDANLSTSNFNGQYIFPDIATYTRAIGDVRGGLSGAQIAANGDGPSQFSLSAGQPSAGVMTGDGGAYAEDDWKARPDLTFSYGGRLESQSAIPDHLDLAPRIGAAWAPVWKKNKAPLLTVRAGFGMFFDRFDSGNLLQTVRQNGTREQVYYLTKPTTFGCQEGTAAGATCTPVVPSAASLTALSSSIYKLNPDLHEQYAMQGGITAERSFGQKGSGSVGWVRARGVHQFEMRNINAPLPGTYPIDNPTSGTRPLGGTQNVYQYSSDGVRNVDSFRSNINFQPTRHLYLWAFYTFGVREADTSGANALPSNQYDIKQDYGPATGTYAQALYAGGGGDLPFGFTGNIFLSARAEQRFNITTGQDLNGDTAYTDRPAFATDLTRASVMKTAFGNFDASPMAGQTLIPINYGVGPKLFYSEVYFARNFHFGAPRPDAIKAAAEAKPGPGKRSAKPEQPYRLGLFLEADNVLNHTNPGPPVGVLPTPQLTQQATQAVLDSSSFGKSISLNTPFSSNGAANRTVSLGLNFDF